MRSNPVQKFAYSAHNPFCGCPQFHRRMRQSIRVVDALQERQIVKGIPDPVHFPDGECLPIGIVKDIFEEYTPDMKAVIQANDTVYTFEEESYLKKHIDSFEDLVDGHVYGLSLAAESREAAAIAAAEINRVYGSSVCAFHNVTHVDIAPIGCSKGTGIEIVRKAFSVREMYGIGDSFNDLPLLQSVDHPYTLSHAPVELRETAEGVVRGVSELLDRI